MELPGRIFTALTGLNTVGVFGQACISNPFKDSLSVFKMIFHRSTGEGLDHAQHIHDDRVGLLSRLTFQWIFPLLSVGYLRPLTKDDTRSLNPTRAVARHQDTVLRLFKRSLAHQRKFPLLWALHDAFKFEFWLGGVAMLLANILQVTAPLSLRYLLVSLSNDTSKRTSFLYVIILFTTQMGMSFALVHYHYLGQVVGSQVKAVLTAMVFEKSLDLSHTESHTWTDGKISTLITVDAQRIESALLYANMIWSEPVAVAMALVILFYNLTWSALGGLILLVIGAKALDLTMSWLVSSRVGINAEVDRRMSSLLEALHNMKFVKLHAWEPYFLRRILNTRAAEVHQQHKLLNLRSTIMALSTSLPSYAAMLSFIIFMTVQGCLTAAEAFSSLALYNCLRKPLNILPMVLSQLIDAWISLQRTEAFLTAEDQRETIRWDLNSVHAIQITDGQFSWDDPGADHSGNTFSTTETDYLLSNEASSPPGHRTPSIALDKIKLTINPGELIAIAGPVGSGKTALLLALAGQMNQTRGQVTLGRTRSICSQVPWIESGTIRENILFGKPLRQPWYDAVVEACALKPDLKTWEMGDETSIGERGITLSGGQNQRISLARTIYADADLVLLDDPFSAVDADVGGHIFDRAVCGLLRGKTCLLVTHTRNILARCDRTLWLENGRIQAFEPVDSIQHKWEPGSSEDAKHDRLTKDDDEEIPSEINHNTIIDAEPQQSGNVHHSVYKTYLSASGSILDWPIVFTLLLVSQIAGIFSGIWLSWWVDNSLGWDHRAYIVGYALLAVAQSIFMWAYLSRAAIIGLRASDNLFQTALQRVIYAPMSFLTANPVGRLMNLFSSDVNQLDNGVSDTIRSFFMLIGIALSTFVLISVQFPLFSISLPVIALVVYYTSAYYRASRQELKRYETVSRSTVAAKSTECIAGRQTIRSFGAQDTFKARLGVAIDEASNYSYLMSASQQWLNLRLDTLGNVLVLFVGALIVISSNSIPASMCGLIMTYALAVVQIIPGIVSQTAEIEGSLITVERMIHYSQIPTETSAPTTLPPPNWPKTGNITLNQVSLRYRDDLPLVLQDVNLTIRDGEKIGIIGRTGAGKSSILSVLFRLFPLSQGKITIDNIDIANIPLHTLRSNLAIIPQDPTLFHGTVRSNLDPTNTHPDSILIHALQKSHLHPQFPLTHPIHQNGTNLSLGERQLLALARTLIQNPRILVCDEATSAVDQDTDHAVQETLLEAFRDKTVICIAHRLRTVIRYEKICVVEGGRVVGFGRPGELFDGMGGGGFREMCALNGIGRGEYSVVASGFDEVDVCF